MREAKAKKQLRVVSTEEWLAEGRELFGEDEFLWRFVCPACGNVARAKDFAPFKSKGATPNSAYQNCIGRFYPKGKRGGWSEEHCNPKIKRPCDYTIGGLFKLCETEVMDSDGHLVSVFEFAKEEQGLR